MSCLVRMKPSDAAISYEGIGCIEYDVNAGELGISLLIIQLEDHLAEIEHAATVIDVEVDVVDVVRAFASDQSMKELIHEAIIQVGIKEVSRLVKEWKS